MADEKTNSTEHLSDDIDDTALADSLALGATDSEQPVAHDVGEQLLSHRTKCGLSLEEAAARASIDPERLAGAEDGIDVLDEVELAQLASAYGVDASSFFGGRVTPFSYLAGA